MIYKLIIPLVLGLCEAKSYENYTLYRGIPIEDRHLEFLWNLSRVYDVNYWRLPGSLRMPVDFVIGPADKKSFLMEASKMGVYLSTILENVQSAFDKQTVKSYSRKRMDTFDWNNFYRTKDIYGWMHDLAKAFQFEVHIISIGKTHENRDILAAKVVLRGSLLRSKVIVEGGIHAREWISPAFVTYMMHRILFSSVSPDKLLRQIALTYEWYFVPIVNPDGYEYTFDEDRQWRKNRNGPGVDLNRNFGIGFGTEGVSFNHHSEVFCGPKAFSEKETAALGKFIRSKQSALEYYLAFHSYGQFMVIPYGHTSKHLANFAEVRELGLKTAGKIRSFYNTFYKVGTAFDTVGYKVSGASTCWVKKTFGVPYAITFELRDQGSYGFALPTNQIIPTCEETLGGLLVFLTPQSKGFHPLDKKYEGERHSFDGAGKTRTCLIKIMLMFYLPLLIIQRFG